MFFFSSFSRIKLQQHVKFKEIPSSVDTQATNDEFETFEHGKEESHPSSLDEEETGEDRESETY